MPRTLLRSGTFFQAVRPRFEPGHRMVEMGLLFPSDRETYQAPSGIENWHLLLPLNLQPTW